MEPGLDQSLSLSPSPSISAEYTGDEELGGEYASIDPNTIAGICFSIFDDLLANLTHDTVLEAHRTEKLLRTEQQQHLAHIAATNAAATVINGTSQPPEDTTTPRMPPGNPLANIPAEMICLRCNLPRHTPETLNAEAATLKNGERKKYCQKVPFHNVRGHDIYGNPFPNPTAAVTKKNRKEAAAAAAAAQTNGNGDSPASTPLTNGETVDIPIKLGKNSGITYFECTSCNSTKIASHRYAAHLEKCLGISGRKSSRNAMAKMNNGNSGSGSPMLAAVDKSSSRKPSPEKNGKPSPAPDEAPASSNGSTSKHSITSAPALPPSASGGSTVASGATPKKKKKSAAATAATKEAAAAKDRERERERERDKDKDKDKDKEKNKEKDKDKDKDKDKESSAPPRPTPAASAPIAPKDGLPLAPTSAPMGVSRSSAGAAGPQKKRKRKVEPSDAGGDSDAPIAASKPKKPKLAASSSSSNAVPSALEKKNVVNKFRSKVGSPAPSSLADRHSPIPHSPSTSTAHPHPSLPKKPPPPKSKSSKPLKPVGLDGSPKKIKKKPLKIAPGGGGVAGKKPPSSGGGGLAGKGVGGVARKGPPPG